MVAGHRVSDCPVNATYDGLYWPQESVHLEETRWCSTEKMAAWVESEGKLKPVWEDHKFQGTCCHYPATAEVWEARYVKINVYDEDNWNSNDLLGSLEVDLHVSARLLATGGSREKPGVVVFYVLFWCYVFIPQLEPHARDARHRGQPETAGISNLATCCVCRPVVRNGAECEGSCSPGRRPCAWRMGVMSLPRPRVLGRG
jgi:hypothetical protein